MEVNRARRNIICGKLQLSNIKREPFFGPFVCAGVVVRFPQARVTKTALSILAATSLPPATASL